MAEGGLDKVRECVAWLEEYRSTPTFANENPIKGRLQHVGYLDLSGCLALGATRADRPRHRLPQRPA